MDTLNVYQWQGTGDAMAFLAALPLTPGWVMPQFINMGSPTGPVTMISLGNQVKPYQYSGGTAFNVITANTGGATLGAATWQANHYYNVGDRIAAQDANGSLATFQVVNVTVGSNTGTMANATPIGGGGYSGQNHPAFNSSPDPGGVVGTGLTIHDNQLIWMLIKQTDTLAMEATPAGGAHIINHNDALWVFNTGPKTVTTPGPTGTNSSTTDGPNVLRMSEGGNPNSWPLSNLAFIGRDDGEQGTGMATFTVAEAGITPKSSLICFKEYSTFSIDGNFEDPSSFGLNQAKTDMGCLASRSIQFATGFGIIRFSHLGFALYDAMADRIISEEIRPYIFGRGDIPGVDFNLLQWGRSALTANPPMYICALPTKDGGYYRVFCYDLVLKAWMVCDFNNGPANLGHHITALRQLRTPIELGPREGVHTFFNISTAGGQQNIEQWQQGDVDWFDVGPVAWKFTPPEVGDPASRAYFRRANVRLHAPVPGSLTGAFNVGEESLPDVTVLEEGANPSHGAPPNVTSQATYNGNQDLGVALTIAQTGPSMNGTYSGAGPATVEGIDYHIMPKNPRPFGQRF